MKAAETRLAELLQGPGQFVVPHFQRAYSWRGAQWATLWADIQELYELGAAQPHFMGSLVLLTEEGDTTGHTRLLIDGQQRLVTLSIFLAALRDRVQAMEPDLSRHIERTYLLDADGSSELPTRVVCSYQDQGAFAAVIMHGETPPGSPVLGAYETFVADLASRDDMDARRLSEVVLNQLRFVAITLDAADNPYRVFESLNAKGMPLTQGDLLRNYFFMRLPAGEHDEWFRTVWQPMQTRLGESLDSFMHDYLAKDGEDVRAEEVYQAWRRRLAHLGIEGVKAVLRDLAEWSEEYNRLLHLNREPETEARRRLEWLSAWSETLKQPLLPFLLLVQADIRRGTLDSGRAACVLHAAQSFLARRVFTSASDADDNQQLVELYNRALGEPDRADAFVSALSQPAVGWPTDDELRSAMLSYRLYPRSHADQRQLLLMALEETYERPMRFRLNDFDIELIAPLIPREEWLAELGGDEDLHWGVVGTIGNLTWIERGQSSRVPLRVSERLQQLRRQARRCPSLARDVEYNQRWSAEAIRERSGKLAERDSGLARAATIMDRELTVVASGDATTPGQPVMAQRTPLVVGNWKAGPPRLELDSLLARMLSALDPIASSGVEVVLCPPFPWLDRVAAAIADSGLQVGAQTLAPVDSGGVTGEVPAPLLSGLCSYALIGHYERRIQCHESNGDIRKRITAALEANIRPIFCVGEPAEALEEGVGGPVLVEQMEAVLEGLRLDERLVIGYAPVWTTIGMIIPPEPSYVNDVCGMLRETLADITSQDLADQTRIIYGGRLTDANVRDLATQPEIDGFLAGAGATSPERFAMIAGALAAG